ncbi:4-hydroxybenzoyl-CoA thioesterase [Deinococcus malanensis]|uniref:4-hydroxybenzoyl-CoA thioesterase n=1 Tax=Deinococcus malanensis TaxID=1706855 RepID=A0ABQ2EQW7_9DEIO|nr:thioesterase family protein [Deinococcus malanensis]GGK16449.1 4-hydroxybenzoyl-CoA thioesterase [Deinococcus malanensis]
MSATLSDRSWVEITGESTIRVRYAETDAMGVVHHATYPVWFEVGRTELMEMLGLPYTEVEARGFYLMISGINVEYRRAARYGDTLSLTTRLGSLRSRTMTFLYELRRGEELVASGETRHIATDKTYRPARLPDDVLHILGGGKDARLPGE